MDCHYFNNLLNMAIITPHELFFNEYCKTPAPWRKNAMKKWFDKDNKFAFEATCAKDRIIEALFLMGIDKDMGMDILNNIVQKQYKKDNIKWVQGRLQQLMLDVHDTCLFNIRMMILIRTIPRPSTEMHGAKLMKYRLCRHSSDVGALSVLPDDIKFNIVDRL